MKIYIDNTTTGIERIVAQCLDNKIVELRNYYPCKKWEIAACKNHQASCLDKGDGTLEVSDFALWLDSHGYTAKNNVRSKAMKISGLKKISGETKGLQGYYSDLYLQLNYDKSDGHAWTDQHCSLGHNSWTRYHDANIINCGILTEPYTMKEIVEIIEYALNR